MGSPVFITNAEVKSVLTWPLINESIEEALKAVVNKEKFSEDHPFAYQNARTRTPTKNNDGLLFTMPGFVGNHKLTLNGGESESFNTLACKLVTWSPKNRQLNPPLPTILANILLLDGETGQLQCVMDGNLITAWRTASASVVATKYLYFGRKHINTSDGVTLAIVGCGVQGESHALGMCTEFKVNEIRLWNRTANKAEEMATQLAASKDTFVNPELTVTVCSTVRECVANSDIIVTGTQTTEPLLHLDMLKEDVHINAVGCAATHYSELGQDIYDVASVYIDYWAGAKTELAGLKTNIVCEVGEVIIEGKAVEKGISVFQSLGMAAEDATVAQAVYQILVKKNEDKRIDSLKML